MAKPSNVKLVMKNMEDSIKALNSGVTDKYRLFILCESVEDVYRLAKGSDRIREINLGGTKSGADRKAISKAVHLSETDVEMVKELVNDGKKVFVQMVPDDTSTDVMNLL